MQEILEVSCRPVHDGIWTPAELMGALERAATDHADALNIGHDRMVADFGSLWMLVRSRLELTRLPAADEALTVRTWLRSPTPVMSVRDYDFCADGEVIGSAVHCWVLVNAEARHMIDLRQIPALWELPVHVPERKTRLRRPSRKRYSPCGLSAEHFCHDSELSAHGYPVLFQESGQMHRYPPVQER